MQQTYPSNPSRPKRQRSSPGLLIILLVLLAAATTGFVCRQRLFDWWRLRDYTPSSAVVQLANEDTMNSYTRHVFYVNHPELLSTVAAFRQVCPEDEEDIVLGCYHSGQNGIFLFNVIDSQLQGVQQVTASHEVLHAVYARLSPKARNNLDQQLEAYYQHGLTDPRVMSEIQIYQRTEPNDVYDEMSCTFGTEIASLPAGLEAYYAQFFTNRATIVAYEQQYATAFNSRQAQITSDDDQLTASQKQITSGEATLSSQLAQITSERAQLQSLESSNPAAYNAQIPAFNTLVNSYNAGVATLRTEISQYNQLVASRNSIAGALDGLDKAIDTRLSTQNATN
jgi:uncharacterized protein YukE